jgi:hypothetical protein
MAAEVLSQSGADVDLYDAMPSVARKFLLAGRGGLNLTHAEAPEVFLTRYGVRQAEIGRWLAEFGPAQLRAWASDLGIDTFVGSSGRVFPAEMKAAPLLRAWLHRLREPACVFTPGIAGAAGCRMGAACAFWRRAASLPSPRMPACWRWAAAVGPGLARTAPGSRCSKPKAHEYSR